MGDPFQNCRRLWQLGHVPDLYRDVLARLGELPEQEVPDFLRYDQRERWHHGMRIPVEAYLRRLPAAQVRLSEIVHELCCSEFWLRIEAGERPEPQEYLDRFPEWCEELRTELEFYFLAANQGLGSTTIYPVSKRFSDEMASNGQKDLVAPTMTPSAPNTPAILAIEGYRVEEEIGHGGMGRVYRAFHVDLRRYVALKVLRQEMAGDPVALSRLKHEAQAVARIRHASIVQIYEVAEHQGLPFLVLEFVPGVNLAKALKTTPLTYTEAARLILALAEAIQVAHDKGIIHRDLKPSNVLIATDGTPKIVDFGLAKDLQASDGETEHGVIKGTLAYMAPEQTGGRTKEIGPATDVYGLGVILYELLTSNPPFHATSYKEILHKIKEVEPAPPSRSVKGLPRDLQTITLKCLEKEPLKRYGSAQQLAEDLRHFVKCEPITARRVTWLEKKWKWVRRNPLLALAWLSASVLTACLLGVLCYAWQHGKVAENVRYIELVGQAQKALASNNTSAASDFLDACPERLRHWEWNFLKDSCTSCDTTVTLPDAIFSDVVFSPDGHQIAAASTPNSLTTNAAPVNVWDAHTGALVCSFHDGPSDATKVAFSGDGQCLASLGTGGISIWDLNKKERRLLIPVPRDTLSIWQLGFSPDAQSVSWVIGGSITIANARNGQVMTTFGKAGGPGIIGSGFTSDGLSAISVDRAGLVTSWPLRAGSEGKPTPLAGARSIRRAVIHQDGKRLATMSVDGTVSVWDCAKGTLVRAFKGDRLNLSLPVFSANAKRLAFATARGAVQVVNVETGRDIATIPASQYSAHGLAFSRDANRLAVASWKQPHGTVELWDVSREPFQIETEPCFDVTDLVSRHHLSAHAFTSTGALFALGESAGAVTVWDTRSRDMLCRLKGPDAEITAIAITPHHVACAYKGRKIGIWKPHSGKLEQAIVTLPKSKRAAKVVLLDGEIEDICFTANGTSLMIATADGAVTIINAETNRIESVREIAEEIYRATFSPDAQFLVVKTVNWLKVYDPMTGSAMFSVDVSAGGRPAVLSPDGNLLAGAVGPGFPFGEVVKVWNISTGKELFSQRGHRDCVTGLSFTEDGRRLASAGHDGRVVIWETESGHQLVNLDGSAGFDGVYFSPDGRLVTSSEEGVIQFWGPPSK